MREQEEREEIKAKIIEDIDYLKKNEKDIRTTLIGLFSDRKEITPIDVALNTVKMNNINYLDTGSIGTLSSFYTNIINRITIASRAFLNNPSNKNTQTELIESAKIFNDYINAISINNSPKELDKNTTAGEMLSSIYKRSKASEDITNDVQSQLNNLHEKLKELNDIKESIADLQSSDTQIEITKTVAQARQLFDKAKDSQELFNNEVQKLISAKERQIAYTLSEQFGKKTAALQWPVWINFTLIFIWVVVLSIQSIKYIELLLDPKISDPLFWKTMSMVLILKLPFIFLIFFNLNEYSKAKKLFEEYEHKRIMASTLVNNLERLKNELHADEKDLLELIKVPFEKIFDNPVHSIYGDKSGDKNLGLDQLEKITSIIEKMKSK